MRFVELKSEEQLDMQILHRARDRLVAERTALINQLRAILLERGPKVAKYWKPAWLCCCVQTLFRSVPEPEFSLRICSMSGLNWIVVSRHLTQSSRSIPARMRPVGF